MDSKSIGLCPQMDALAETRDRTGDLQIFGLTLSQLSYRGYVFKCQTLHAQRLSAYILRKSFA